MSDPLEGDIHIGKVSSASVNWRDVPFDDTDDDVELEKTPDDVIAMLGFDPKSDDDLKKFNEHHDEKGRFSSVDDMRNALNQHMLELAKAVTESLGYKEKVEIKPGVEQFTVGDKVWTKGGSCNLSDGTITLYPDALKGSNIVPLVAHEVMHGQFEVALGKYNFARQQMQEEYSNEPQQGPHNRDSKIMAIDGTIRPYALQKWPVLNDLRALNETDALKRSDGVSDYSKAYWDDYSKGKIMTKYAIHETLAEMASAKMRTGVLPGAPVWQELYKGVEKQYRQVTRG